MAPARVDDHVVNGDGKVVNGDAMVAPPADEATNGVPETKKSAATNGTTDAAATDATSQNTPETPSAAAATNGTSEKATFTTATSTNDHSHVPEGQHQRCCCCCQLRSKGVVEVKTESKDDKKDGKEDDKKDGKEDEKKDKKDSDADEKKDAEDQTMKCEIKHLDRKYDDKDERYFVERKDDVEKPEQKDWWRLYAFCVVRHFDSDGDIYDTRLYVNPLPLRQLMHDVIGNYPSEPIDVDDVQISTPYHCLFHCRKDLEAEGVSRFEKAEDTESLKQLTMLMDWIKKHFELEIAAYERCVSSDLKAIPFDKLWTLFRPQSLVYSKVFNKPRAFRVWDHWVDEEYGEDETPGLVLRVEYMDYDGEDLGTRTKDIFIPRYTGTRELCKLNAMPLDMLEDATAKREMLLKRGRLFESYVGQHYMQYTGVGFKPNPCGGYDRLHVDCRVMVDCKTFHEEESNYAFTVKELPPADEEAAERRALRRNAADGEVEDEEPELRPLSDEEAIIATSMVRGYAFANKQFVEFFAEDLEPISWNEKCFDQLVLDAGTKRTVQALVSVHSTQQQRSTQAKFDDIVKGKGQGVVCVLHGPPGVGKTLTAECVAEYVRRPLYMVSSGDLGVDASDLDKALARIMRMTSAWNAVLLIDEADVFLEQRSPQNLHRNAMVSVFLRLLEYFAGILFLTTNRVSSFDDAFKSRIHIPIRYTNLSEESRLQIWRNFLARIPRGEEADRPIVDEKDLRRLAEHDLNGRQIKNVIKAAESLAAFEGKRLDMEQLEEVTKIQARFEADLTNLSGIDYTAPGAAKKDAEMRQMFL